MSLTLPVVCAVETFGGFTVALLQCSRQRCGRQVQRDRTIHRGKILESYGWLYRHVPQAGQVRLVLRGSTATTGTPFKLGFVLDKAAQLGERPAMQGCSLRPTNRYPITNPAKFFEGDSATGVFGLSNNALADVVVCPGGELPFFAGQFLETAARGLRAFGLELLAQLAVTVANVLDRLALVDRAVTINGDIGNPKIDTKKAVNVG